MSVVILDLDESTVRGFVADDDAFGRSVDARFEALDANGDGVLSLAGEGWDDAVEPQSSCAPSSSLHGV
ncbi:hypothetical protein OsJ_23276 [Oryza sativa Japonica Group]|uniref:EF-hand domain-containing protein n=1 Tax=Oryza sativa subsp. japonica TaxID=39947 RepID=B9FVR7_ORYSJ|nr:hypothetical protein OsJ_23276 [Oryza sativa Japonica Group]